MKTTTIKDIARALNMSTSTVSRALRDSYEINPATKKLILDYAEKMHYSPNPIALSLKESRSKSIGVIVPEIANNFFSQTINGIEAVAAEYGYHVVIFQSHESYEKEVINTQHLVSRRVDGLLVSLSSLTTDTRHFEELVERGLPVVFFDRIPKNIRTFKIIADNFLGSYQATEHLLEMGCRKIAHVTSPSWLSITKERLGGYQQALEKFGVPFQENYIKYCEHGGMVTDEIETAVQQLLDLPAPPDAIFTASDRITTGCMSYLRRQKLRIPEDIALVGFTNIAVADLLDPPLTAVTQPAFEMGQLATELLLSLIQNPEQEITNEIQCLKTTLTVRASSVQQATWRPS
ncbi:LacI family transcriptional regulator [Rhabdobacter roseus]|uniref:LacI family transcriptional regulator n=1 Tax=Rhabdobacter roseus TaxID=1655419 RepID=A0A840TLB9_9BACT|nr:LacI family DNA-binding transcriptional regulator [Rhabdobacter roseus]MBB5283735.1 LacI family transcriptional regulator [Rhabdobacter roseus]